MGEPLDPCGFLTARPDGTIVEANRTFLEWTGYARDDLVGRRTFASLLTAGGRIYHETHYAPMLRMQGTAREIALDIVCADGRRVPALVSSVVERDDAGEPVLIRTAIFEATQRREYERELLRAKERAEQSEERAQVLVRTLQQTLVPPAMPHIDRLDLAAAYRPAGDGQEIGGDFYDVFQTGPDEWIVAIGDVQGKGVAAAVVTALARYTIRAGAMQSSSLADVLELLNDAVKRSDTDRFCTVALMRFAQVDGTWTATVAVGGHPLPILVRPGSAPSTIGRYGTLIGMDGEVEFSEHETVLEPGDAVVLYTDGITEARRGREWFGESGLDTAISRAGPTAASLTQVLLDEVLAFQSGFPRDDIAIVVVRVPSA